MKPQHDHVRSIKSNPRGQIAKKVHFQPRFLSLRIIIVYQCNNLTPWFLLHFARICCWYLHLPGRLFNVKDQFGRPRPRFCIVMILRAINFLICVCSTDMKKLSGTKIYLERMRQIKNVPWTRAELASSAYTNINIDKESFVQNYQLVSKKLKL